MDTLIDRIASAEKELSVRESAAKHLSGIPRQQNEVAMERLCDTLTDLNIQRHEANGTMTTARIAAIRRRELRGGHSNGHI